jgi:hypothetical protein
MQGGLKLGQADFRHVIQAMLRPSHRLVQQPLPAVIAGCLAISGADQATSQRTPADGPPAEPQRLLTRWAALPAELLVLLRALRGMTDADGGVMPCQEVPLSTMHGKQAAGLWVTPCQEVPLTDTREIPAAVADRLQAPGARSTAEAGVEGVLPAANLEKRGCRARWKLHRPSWHSD